MKLQQSEVGLVNMVRACLSACILGLALCPFAYIAIGALGGFAPAFSFLALPLLLASSGFLIYRFIWKRTWVRANKLLLLAEAGSWVLIVTFLGIVSGFTLQTRFERAGLFATLFLSVSLLCLPLVLMRNTALRERLGGLPDQFALPLLLVIILTAAGTMAVYLFQSPAFL